MELFWEPSDRANGDVLGVKTTSLLLLPPPLLGDAGEKMAFEPPQICSPYASDCYGTVRAAFHSWKLHAFAAGKGKMRLVEVNMPQAFHRDLAVLLEYILFEFYKPLFNFWCSEEADFDHFWLCSHSLCGVDFRRLLFGHARNRNLKLCLTLWYHSHMY